MPIITEEQFKKAPLSTPFMVCCPICERKDGTIAIKKKGPIEGPSFSIGDMIPGSPCKWCLARESMKHQGVDDVIGAASIQDGDKVLAFITIQEGYSTISTKEGECEIKHGSIVDGVQDEDGITVLRLRSDFLMRRQ